MCVQEFATYPSLNLDNPESLLSKQFAKTWEPVVPVLHFLLNDRGDVCVDIELVTRESMLVRWSVHGWN